MISLDGGTLVKAPAVLSVPRSHEHMWLSATIGDSTVKMDVVPSEDGKYMLEFASMQDSELPERKRRPASVPRPRPQDADSSNDIY
jgi:hypothetical protein